MMQKINLSPVPTSCNFGINWLKIDESELCAPLNHFENFCLSSGDFQQSKTGVKLAPNTICELLQTQHKNANFAKKLVFKHSTQAPVTLEFDFDAHNNALADILNIVLMPNVKVQLVLKYKGQNNSHHNGSIFVDLKKGSALNLVVYANTNGNNFLSIYDQKEQNASVDYTLIDFAKKYTVQNIQSVDKGANTRTTLDTMYFGTDDATIDQNFLVKLTKPKSEAKLNTIGALMDTAKKHYKGTIDFQQGAKKSVGDENEFCMLLSPKAKSRALPMLLCGEEDVSGSHASSAGKVDKQELFYITSRGLTQAQALKLLVKAKFANITNKVFDTKLKEEIFEEIDRRMNGENKQ